MDVPRASGKIVPELGTVLSNIRLVVSGMTTLVLVSAPFSVAFDIVRDIEIIVRFIKTTIYSLYK